MEGEYQWDGNLGSDRMRSQSKGFAEGMTLPSFSGSPESKQ